MSSSRRAASSGYSRTLSHNGLWRQVPEALDEASQVVDTVVETLVSGLDEPVGLEQQGRARPGQFGLRLIHPVGVDAEHDAAYRAGPETRTRLPGGQGRGVAGV
jgi:hypothetical protein